MNGEYTKLGVSQEEVNGFKKVYPENIIAENRLVINIQRGKNGKFNVRMKRKQSLENIMNRVAPVYISNYAAQMLRNQLKRLHRNRAHTNLKATTFITDPRKKTKENYAVIARQILVDTKPTENEEGGVVITKAFLTDFENLNVKNGIIRTNNQKNQVKKNEKSAIGALINYLTKKSPELSENQKERLLHMLARTNGNESVGTPQGTPQGTPANKGKQPVRTPGKNAVNQLSQQFHELSSPPQPPSSKKQRRNSGDGEGSSTESRKRGLF
jgi:hypothetical protein